MVKVHQIVPHNTVSNFDLLQGKNFSLAKAYEIYCSTDNLYSMEGTRKNNKINGKLNLNELFLLTGRKKKSRRIKGKKKVPS